MKNKIEFTAKELECLGLDKLIDGALPTLNRLLDEKIKANGVKVFGMPDYKYGEEYLSKLWGPDGKYKTHTGYLINISRLENVV